MTEPPLPPADAWPTPDEPTLVSRRETVVVGPPPVGPPDSRIGAGMLLALGAVALVVIGVLLVYFLTRRDTSHSTTVTTVAIATSPTVVKVVVPQFVGMKEADALARIGQAGLQPKEVFETQSASSGVVLSEAPAAAASVAKGSVVTLVVAKPPTKTTPSTTTPAPVTTTRTTTTASTTTSTLPPTTTAPTATAPTGPAQPANATVPDVSGQNEAQAAQALNQAGILASLVFVPSSDPLGAVEQQAKSAGTTVPYHAHVQLNLSKGPNATTNAQVPDVVGQTLTEALGHVNGAHLRLLYLKFPVTSKSQAGKIVQQTPLGGGQVPQNAQVLVYLGAYRVG